MDIKQEHCTQNETEFKTHILPKKPRGLEEPRTYEEKNILELLELFDKRLKKMLEKADYLEKILEEMSKKRKKNIIYNFLFYTFGYLKRLL